MIRSSIIILALLFVQFFIYANEIQKERVSLTSLNDHLRESLSRDSSIAGENISISLLTLTPGADLYSVFGHSAIRVKDSNIGTDIVYNYGTFDFNDPDFLHKFIKGELDYFVSQESFDEFIYFYSSEGRGVNEQLLNLTNEQKIKIQHFLFRNMEPNNRLYRYNFLYNNCTTKLRDIIEEFRSAQMSTVNLSTTKGMSFRDGLHYYLDRANQPWIKLGIDIILGSRIDKKMNNYEAQFLPEFLEEGMDSTKIAEDHFVKTKLQVLPNNIKVNKESWLTPMIIFCLLMIIYIGLIFFKSDLSSNILRYIDLTILTVSGIVGCLLVFLWVFSLHEQSKENYNLLWAWPTHIIAVFFSRKKNKIVKNYFLLNALIMLLTLICWPWLPQQLNQSLIPIMIIQLFSGIRLLKK